MSDIVKIFVLVGVVIASVVVNFFAPKKYHDTPMEEGIENIIQKQTGLDVDLTPASDEDEWVEPEEDDDMSWTPWNDVEWGELFDESGTATDAVQRVEDGLQLVNGIIHDSIE